MARLALALVVTVGILSASAHGYEFNSAKRYVSRIVQKASNFVVGPKDSVPYPTQDSRVPFVCERDGLFSDPLDCGRYMRCFNGVSYGLPCANEQHFNNKTQKCEEPCEAHCDRRIACECGWDSCATTEESETMSYETHTYEEDDEFRSEPRFPCPTDGVWQKPHPSDCTKYVHCTYGRAHVMECPAGLHFSKLTGRCQSPCTAQCDPTADCKWKSALSKGPRKSIHTENCKRDGLYPNPDSCATYIHCTNGEKYVMPCPRGLHFSAENQICETPCEARCDPSMAEECRWEEIPENDFDVCRRRPYPGPCSKNVVRWYFDANEGMCRKFIYGGCRGNGNNFKTERECSFKCLRRGYSLKQSDATSNCTGREDGLYRNPDDCATYVQCSNGQGYVMPCPKSLHFSEEHRRCEEPCDAHCDDSIGFDCDSDEQRAPSEDRLLPPDYPPFVPEPWPPVKRDVPCPKDGRYPTPDCSVYLECTGGQLTMKECPVGQHYSQKIQKCADECNAFCDPFIAGRCGWEKTKYGVVKQRHQEVEDGLYPNLEDCGSYLQCLRGWCYLMQCPTGLHFSEYLQRCDDPCEARCDYSMAYDCGWESGGGYRPYDRPSYVSPYIQPLKQADLFKQEPLKQADLFKQDFDCPADADGLYPKPRDCGSYIECVDGRPALRTCPEGQHFSPESRSCEPKCEAKCDPDVAEECEREETNPTEKSYYSLKQPVFDYHCVHNGLFENDADCHSFIQCTGGSAYLITCSPGLDFNPNSKRCESPCSAGCNPDAVCPPDSESSPARRDRLRPYVRPTKLYHDYTCEKDGTFRDNRDCQNFIQCSNGHSYVMKCPGGLHFSEETDRCEAPCDARCDMTIARTCGWDMEDIFSRKPEYDFACSTEDLHPHPDQCSSYIECSGSRAYEVSCPQGYHFSARSKRCETPCDAHCHPDLACECDWPECSNDLRTGEEVDCDAEYDTGPCERKIPRYYYDADSGRCRTFNYSGCGGNSNNFLTEEECERKCQQKLLGGFRCPSKNGKFGHNPDCVSYYHCKKGIPTLKRCPKGTAFDHLKAKCVTEYEATCVYKCRDPDAVYPYEQDCHKYIDCVNGVSKLENCPPELAFDPVQRDCVSADTVSCPWR